MEEAKMEELTLTDRDGDTLKMMKDGGDFDAIFTASGRMVSKAFGVSTDNLRAVRDWCEGRLTEIDGAMFQPGEAGTVTYEKRPRDRWDDEIHALGDRLEQESARLDALEMRDSRHIDAGGDESVADKLLASYRKVAEVEGRLEAAIDESDKRVAVLNALDERVEAMEARQPGDLAAMMTRHSLDLQAEALARGIDIGQRMAEAESGR